MEATLAYLRALLCRDGVDEMRRDAQIARDGLEPGQPVPSDDAPRRGRLVPARGRRSSGPTPIFARAVDAATRAGSLPFVPVLLAERGIVAIERDDWAAAEAFADAGAGDDAGRRVRRLLDERARLRVGGARGRCIEATSRTGRQFVARAARLRPLLTYALPVVSVQALLEMARAYIALGDPGGARAVLRQADDIFQQRPELGILPRAGRRAAGQGRHDPDRRRSGASSLTTAELRLLPLLPTHLSFREIGERLYVSRHTVKTQAISIYRKLGVSSRSEAIDRMHELGLLEQL